MKIYKVGGCVRDTLMGIEPKDIDYVIVGATDQDVKSMLAKDYENVGADFPVFIHKKTKEEYALARTERKTGAGYNGFDYSTENVTLEEDLMRRDLTINSMAMDWHGNIIDPYNGRQDLQNKILRHVGVHFKEDPVRILRIARFSARYDFSIASETIEFMREMVDNGEFDSLTGERVWKEFEKVLPEQHLNNFFNILEEIGALQKIPGFTEVKEQEFFEYIRANHSDKLYDLSLVHVFSQMNAKDLKKWKMPSEEQQKVSYFSTWKNSEGIYSGMSLEDKISFIQSQRALHSIDKAAETLSAVLAYQNWKNDLSLDIKQEVNSLNNDILLLKNLDYPSIVQEALKNKQKPDQVVRQAQFELLQNQAKPKFKL